MLLWNRVLWIAIGLALMTLTVALFKPMRSGTGRRWFGRAAKAPRQAPAAALHVPAARARPRRARAPALSTPAPLGASSWRSGASTPGRAPGVAVRRDARVRRLQPVGSLFLSDVMFGTKVLPVTHVMLEAISGSYSFLLTLILGFYAGS
jgi:hypothetical protein